MYSSRYALSRNSYVTASRCKSDSCTCRVPICTCHFFYCRQRMLAYVKLADGSLSSSPAYYVKSSSMPTAYVSAVAVSMWPPGSFVCARHSNAQIPTGSSRHVSTRHVRRVERVETRVSSRAVRQARHGQNAWARHLEPSNVSCRDVT